MNHRTTYQKISFGLGILILAVWHSVLTGPSVTAQESDDLFLFRPDTPERQVRGAILAEQLDRPTLARGYLTELVASAPDASTLLKLRKKFGIGEFLRLAMISDLQPASRELLNLINKASKQEAPTQAMVASLIEELGTSEQRTKSASLEILSAEDQAVRPLLSADSATPQGRIADALLKRYSRRFRFGLLRELPNSAPDEQVRILRLLETSEDPSMAFDLLPFRYSDDASVAQAAMQTTTALNRRTASATTPEQGAQLLYEESMALMQFAAKPFPTENDRRELVAVTDTRPAEDAEFGTLTLKRATELAALAALIQPSEIHVQALHNVAEATEHSWPAQWPEQLARGNAAASPLDRAMLNTAAETGNTAALLAILSRESSGSVLREEPNLLRFCRYFSDIRVRLAAEFIHGDSRKLSELCDQVKAGSTRPELTLIDSRISQTRRGMAALEQLGYEAAGALSGQQGFEIAINQSACELIVIHSNCQKWPLSMTVANLRADYRTQNVPIVVFGPARDEDAIDHLQHRLPGIWFLQEPISEMTFADAARLAGVPSPRLSEEERQRMIDFARLAVD